MTPAKQGKENRDGRGTGPPEQTPAERRAAMTWAQRLKRVFGIEIETFPAFGGAMRIIACIEDPDVIEKILTHLYGTASEPKATGRPQCRTPPQRGCWTRRGDYPKMTSCGLRRRRRGHGGGWPEPAGRGKRADAAVVWERFRRCDAKIGPEGRAKAACRRQMPGPLTGATARGEPTNRWFRWFILPILSP